MTDTKHPENNKMTNQQTAALLEAVKIIVENTPDDEKKLEAIERIQDKLKNPDTDAQP